MRRHESTLPFRELKPLELQGRCATGMVFEQPIRVDDPDHPGVSHPLRRIVLQLDQPTREGDTEIVLVTNLPAAVSAIACCDAYRQRWQAETHFQTLTDLLHCEVPSLGYPRAALFGFSMSVVAGNALAVLQGNLRAAHGEEMAREVSLFAVVDEAAEVYPGMMVAVPPAQWDWVRSGNGGRGGWSADRLGGQGPHSSHAPSASWPEEAPNQTQAVGSSGSPCRESETVGGGPGGRPSPISGKNLIRS